MSMVRCPGQDTRFWKPEDIFEAPCPHCGQTIEFWKTDVTVRCPHCKKFVPNPKFDPGCAAWCPYATKCLGEIARTYQSQPQVLRDRLEAEVRKALAGRSDDLQRSLRAAAHALALAKEEGAEMVVAVAASLLHRVFAVAGAAAAEEIMRRLGMEEATVAEVQAIIGGLEQPAREESSANFRVVADAVALAELEAGANSAGAAKTRSAFYTAAAQRLAAAGASIGG